MHTIHLDIKDMPSQHSKKILLVPLDWGLGHTTRCVPIIRALLDQGHVVDIGGTPLTNKILKQEFPQLYYRAYPSYGITYPKNASRFLTHIMKRVPAIAKVVRAEKKITKKLCNQHQYDIVISDNRFGVRCRNAKNVFISHQLNLSVPQSRVAQWLVNKVNQHLINKYDLVAVPDVEGGLLSGTLSQPIGIHKEVLHLGCISRWEVSATKQTKGVLAIISGPEPQRSMLEKILIKQATEYAIKLTIVRGKPTEKEDTDVHEQVTFYNHLAAAGLQQLVSEHEIIISRAGYTTILDLVSIGKHAILIPTPGQTEQEYLADYLAQQQDLFLFYSQAEFDLRQAIHDFRQKKWRTFDVPRNAFVDKIEKLID